MKKLPMVLAVAALFSSPLALAKTVETVASFTLRQSRCLNVDGLVGLALCARQLSCPVTQWLK